MVKRSGKIYDSGLPLIIIQNDLMIAWRGYNLNKVLYYKDGFMQEKSDTH